MPGDPNKLIQFWQELKRRRVIHVIVVYATAAFVIIELINNVTEPLKLPEWTPTLVIIILLVGFPLAIIFSWIFDVTPEGIEKTKPSIEISKEEKTASPNSWRIATYVSGVIIIGLLAYNIFGNRSAKIDGSLEKSIAVLPFLNLSGDPNQDFICDGLSGEIINNLFKIESFDRVPSLTTVLKYKGTDKSTTTISEELGVNYILECTYKRMEDILRFTVLLKESKSDKQIWHHDYDRESKELSAIPSEIAIQIADHLKAFISEDEQQRIEKIRTSNPEAFELFQQVIYYFVRRDYFSQHIEKTLFKIIELDPEYADAYAWLGWTSLIRVTYAADNSDTSHLSVYDALSYMNKALELDPDNAYAYSFLGLYNLWVKWDYPEAEKNFLKATHIEPNNSFIKIGLADLYLSMERMEKLKSLIPAIEEGSDLAMGYYAKLKNHRAFQESREKYYELAGELALPSIGEYYIWLGEYDSARYVCEKGLKLGITEMSTPRFKSSLALAYHKTGDSMKAREIINELISDSEQSLPGSIEYFIGLYYSGTGDADSAFYWLEKAYNRHSVEMYWLRVNPVLDNIRDDPHYRDLYERTGHKDYDDYMASKNN